MLIGLLSYRTETLLLDLPLPCHHGRFRSLGSLALRCFWLAMPTTAVATCPCLACRLLQAAGQLPEGSFFTLGAFWWDLWVLGSL